MWWPVIVALGLAGGTELGIMLDQVRHPDRRAPGGWILLTALLGIALVATAAQVYPVG